MERGKLILEGIQEAGREENLADQIQEAAKKEELQVTPDWAGGRLDKVLSAWYGEGQSRSFFQKLIKNGQVQVNGCVKKANYSVNKGDFIQVEIPAPKEIEILPENIPLDILYEDLDLLVVNKPAGLASIPSSLSPEEPSLAQGLVHYLGPGACVHLVNRLDRGTTGAMAAAKTAYVHNLLRERLHTGAFRRTYLAVCMGGPEREAGEIRLPIGRDPASAIRRQVDPAGKAAETAYRVLERRGGFSLVELTPRTGRTHQLRVHMAALGCPLAGDWLYGTEDRALIPRPALHAARLELAHPLTGEALALEAPLPEDMARLMMR